MSALGSSPGSNGVVQDYPSVRVVGNVLPPEILPAVSAHRLPRMSAGDYNLPLGMTPDNAAAHAYNYLQSVWQAWNHRLSTAAQAGEDVAALTREQWLMPLLKHLGYEDDVAAVSTKRGITILTGFQDEKVTYPVSHEVIHARDQHDKVCAALPIHLVSPEINLDERPTGDRSSRAAHSMLQEFLNRTPTRLYGLLTNGHTLRLLRDVTNLDRQAYLEFDLDQIFANNLQRDFRLMWLLLHATRFTPDIPAASDPEPAADAQVEEELDAVSEDDAADEEQELAQPALPAVASPATCALESWRSTVFSEGTRALDALRDGISAAITTLGTGFVRHPANTHLREQLATTPTADDDLRRWLLRAVYRLIVLFVAEDRDLLHARTSPRAQRDAYARYFSTRRLRDLAATTNGTRHHDLWEAHRLVTDALGGQGLPDLGLPGLASTLYEPDALGLLADASISNHYLLAAIRHLSLITDKHGVRRPVDYRNLDSEELGGAYEALLAFVPRYTPAAQAADHTFTLEEAAGSERKKSGAYYTPTSLISVILDETLDPLIHDALASSDPAKALLELTVVDPACGSGHFLVAAARRLARALAAERTSDPEPAPEALREAMGDVVANCIYGVDLNDLAIEITKVALWLESLQPGIPFAFLDHHIKQGNALIGTTPELLRGNIPDSAFKVLVGDNADTNKRLKAANKNERAVDASGQSALFDEYSLLPDSALKTLTSAVAAVERKPQRTLADVRAVAAAWRTADADPLLARARLTADAWCAAFMQAKPDDRAHIGITHELLKRLAADQPVPHAAISQIQRLSAQHRYFHWHLEFPQVFNGPRGGFACVLGNPPWEKVKLKNEEWLRAVGRDDIANAKPATRRKALIAELEGDDPSLWAALQADLRTAAETTHFLLKSDRYPLTGTGDLDLYPLFAEHNTAITGRRGRAGFITPTGLAVDKTRSAFFRNLTTTSRLAAFYDFVNGAIFPSVDSRFRFAVSVVTGDPIDGLKLAFLNNNTSDIPSRLVTLTAQDVLRINPNTGTLPLLADQRDADILAAVYRRFPVIRRDEDPDGNPWDVSPRRMFDMTNDAGLFAELDALASGRPDGHARILEGVRYLPLYEGKHFWLYDHRYATSEGVQDPDKPRNFAVNEQANPSVEVQPRYWVKESEVQAWYGPLWGEATWEIAFRGNARATDARTMVVAVIPKSACGNAAPLLRLYQAEQTASLVAVWSSLVFDFVARQKMSGPNMNFFILDQIATPTPSDLAAATPFDPALSWADWLRPRVLELTYTSHSLAGWAKDLSYEGPPFAWDIDRRRQLQAEIDGVMFHLYGHDRSTTEYILDSFNVLRRSEEREFGEFITKRLVLAAYDALAGDRG